MITEVKIRVRFALDTPHAVYRKYHGALEYSLDEYAKLNERDIEAAANAQMNGWLQVIAERGFNQPPPASDETSVAIMTRLDAIDAKLAVMTTNDARK